jgi:polyhydroxyalkanoate synthesis regulator phasin
MSSPLTEKYKAVSQSINETKDKLIEQYRKVKEANDEKGMLQIGANLESIIQKSDQATRAYEQEQAVRKESLLSGISSGELISDKQKPIKSFVQFPDPSGARNYGEEFNYSPLIYNPNKARKAFAELVETDPKKVDVTTGVGLEETTFLAGLQDDEARKAYLQQNYEEVLPINTVGSSNFLVKNKEGNYILALPKGINMKDVGAAVATETLPLAAGIGAGIASIGTGPAAPFVASGASNLAYSGVGAIQDVAFRKMAGLPAGVGQVAAERGKEAVVGGLIDLATYGVSRPFTKRVGTAIENNVAKELRESTELLQKKGMDVDFPVGAEGGTMGLKFQRELAGKFPKMAVAKTMEKTRGVMASYQKAIEDKVIGVPRVDITNRVKAEADQLAAMIEKQNVRLQGQAKGWVNNRLKQIMPDKTNQVDLGNTISGLMEDAATKGQAIKDQAYRSFYDETTQRGVNVPKQEVLNTIEGVLAGTRNDFKRNPSIERLYRDIASSEESNFSAEQLRNIVQVARDSVPLNASKTADQVAVGVSKALDDKFNEVVSRNGLGDLWSQTNKTYDETSLAFRRSSPGKILSEQFGNQKLSPSQMVDATLANEKTVADVLSTLKNTGDEAGADALQTQLKNAYLEKIGITSAYKGTNSKYKPEMVDALWGNPLAAKRVNSTIEELNNSLKASKVDVVDISPEDANRLLDIIPVNERQKLIDDIVKKGKIQAREDRLMSNEVVKQAKRGNWTYLDNDIFADTMLNKASTSDVLEITKRLPLAEKQKVGADMFARLLSDYSTAGTGANQARFGFDLWDAEKVIKDLGGWNRVKGTGAPQWVKNMDAVVGKDTVDEFIAASRVQAASRPIGKAESLELRGLTSATGVKVYAAPFQYIGNKILATAYGSNNLRPFLRGLSKDIGDEAYQRNASRMLKGIIGTRMGLQAAAIQGRNDPDFQEQMQIILAEAQAEAEQQR